MSLVSFIGPRPNLLDVNVRWKTKRLEVDQPILTNTDLERIRRIENHLTGSFKTLTLSICYKKNNNYMISQRSLVTYVTKLKMLYL